MTVFFYRIRQNISKGKTYSSGTTKWPHHATSPVLKLGAKLEPKIITLTPESQFL